MPTTREWQRDAQGARRNTQRRALRHEAAAASNDRAALDEFVGSIDARIAPREELTAALQAAGVSAYPVQNCMDIHQDENLEAFDFWHWLEHKEMGPSPYEGLQHRMSRTPGELRGAAPILGQHNEEVFRGMLGARARTKSSS